jgi:ubiquinone/menaquinone biosynthesis C-methylase UbiE
MTNRGLLLYHELAKHYDAMYSWKDYRAETRRLEAIARRFGRSRGTDWLDVACGTGKHLEFLQRQHRCVGVDGSREMLRVARRRLPHVRFVHGDMRTFRLDRRFDVVSCLFSAIAHMRTERDLERSFVNFARHLKPGGVAVVEPWIQPAAFCPGKLHLTKYEGGGTTIVRLAVAKHRGARSIIDYHYLIGERGRGIHHFEETDLGLMVPRARLVSLMRSAGLSARFLGRGFTGDRGLLIGTKRRD